ncbi:FIST signal transduction protein [Jiulongibacter sp. NS-SX5]|uniref:FIST signal transduction protein n=1 Tax=Jiulongibacter sp. NS-SX5 TaxID=3463854 RepID=UPI0040596518
MLTSLLRFDLNEWKAENENTDFDSNEAQLVLCFGGKDVISAENFYAGLSTEFPKADVAMCSTSGEILQETVSDDSAVAVAFQFDSTKTTSVVTNISDHTDSFSAGEHLYQSLKTDDLTYILVLSDGALVNGSELVKGLSHQNTDVLVTGGLAGDADKFESTLVGLNENPSKGKIIAIGFYGENFKVSHGSQGGWEEFGLEREVTKSEANVLYEIDGMNALELYKKYLGEASKELPGAALLYPLAVTIPGSTKPIVRTILSIDEETQGMTFAGDVPEGSKVRLMRAYFDRLSVAAADAAAVTKSNGLEESSFALLISCVGRKLVLGPRVEDEVEAVIETLGENVPVAGFYSYGEISPFNDGGGCQLHNQTMTITTFHELSQTSK